MTAWGFWPMIFEAALQPDPAPTWTVTTESRAVRRSRRRIVPVVSGGKLARRALGRRVPR